MPSWRDQYASFEDAQLQEVRAGRRRPEPMFRQGFQYDGKLTAQGFERQDPDVIRRLVIEPGPEVSAHERAEWKVKHKKRVTLKWLASVASHYGLYLSPLVQGKEILLKDVRKFIAEPSYSEHCRRQLGSDEHSKKDPRYIERYVHHPDLSMPMYECMVKYWTEQCAAFAEVMESDPRRKDFNKLATKEEQLAFDTTMFLDVYFLDRRTTPDVLALNIEGTNIDLAEVQKISSARAPGLTVKGVGRAKKSKTIWMGWDGQAVLEASQGPAHAGRLQNGAVKKELEREANAEARREPHRAYMARRAEQRGQSRADDASSPEGAYMLEVSGPGWREHMYAPSRQFMDIRATDTSGVYEATFRLDPALRGCMLLGANTDALAVHGRIEDTAAFYTEDSYVYGESTRDAFRAGLLLGMTRKRKRRDERAEQSWKRRLPQRRDEADAVDMDVLWRGTTALPDGEVDKMEATPWGGKLKFEDDRRLEFTLHLIAMNRDAGVPAIDSDATIVGYRIADYPQHEAVAWGDLRHCAELLNDTSDPYMHDSAIGLPPYEDDADLYKA
ncbi:hypothetical protein GGR56DRAFT_636664 [Xylariaceae sp. FL0804]|nr:hypothetical protein GGR56DRAFT_636664 [Xylariaceae sp. FL0804]